VTLAPAAPAAAADTGKPVQDSTQARLPGKQLQISTGTTTNTPAGAVSALSAAQSQTGVAPVPPVQQAGFIAFPRDKMPAATVPVTPTPAGLTFNESLKGDAERGRALISTGQGGCVGCHVIRGNPMMAGQIGPNLTHIGSRTTIAAGLYPNDPKHLSLWIKNARMMKPGVVMPTIGKGQYDPMTKMTLPAGLTDEQIADIVAYLQALK
jgi:cytochrome c oxidase subunit 2